MTAYNVVRMKVKAGKEQEYLNAHKTFPVFDGMQEATVIKTGDRTYCVIGKWESFDKLVAARPQMVKTLDTFRGMLEDLGGGLGVTDPVSGEAVFVRKN